MIFASLKVIVKLILLCFRFARINLIHWIHITSGEKPRNIVMFITHKTLDKTNAELCLRALFQQLDSNPFIEKLYIYNSNQLELPNEQITGIIEKLNINKLIPHIGVFKYDCNTPKTLGSDIKRIRKYLLMNYRYQDRVLILKSDIILSSLAISDFKKLLDTKIPICITPPYVLTKKIVPVSTMIEYSRRSYFVRRDEITFFTESSNKNALSDFENSRNINPTDSEILFLSCTVKNDFSCHFVSVCLLPLIIIKEQPWGGVWFERVNPWFAETTSSFSLHMYHSVRSTNNNHDRIGPVNQWLEV